MMEDRPLIILGAGGNCSDIVDAVDHAVHGTGRGSRILGFLDDDPTLTGATRSGLPVLGPLSDIDRFPHADVVNGIGSPTSFRQKSRLIAALALDEKRFRSIVHPTVAVARTASIGHGTVLLAHVSIASSVRIGNHVMILQNSVVGHDTVVGDYATMAAGVTVSGAVSIGVSSYVGAAACIRDHVTVGEGALVGMGSVVASDVAPGATVRGNPARAS